MNKFFNREAAVLFCLLIVAAAYMVWAVRYMNHQHGWDGFLVFVYLLPPGVVAVFTILAKLIAHLRGKPVPWAKALGIGILGLAASFAVLLTYTWFNS
jgi:hypothetical protein